MGMTMAEKMLAEHAGKTEVKAGEYVWARVDGTALTRSTFRQLEEYGVEVLFDPDRV